MTNPKIKIEDDEFEDEDERLLDQGLKDAIENPSGKMIRAEDLPEAPDLPKGDTTLVVFLQKKPKNKKGKAKVIN